MTKRALVLGCTGQDGSFLTQSLLNKNYDVYGISRSKNPDRRNHKVLDIEKKFKLSCVNLFDLEEVTEFIEDIHPNEIYNLTCQSSVGLSFVKPLTTLRSIVDITRNILESSRRLNFDGKLFFAGSGEVFGETTIPATINSQKDPKSPYAVGKYESMLLVKLYRDCFGLKSKTGILFNHESFLRGKNFFTSKLISGAIECSLDKSKKLKLGNLSLYRDWGCAKEYVEAMQLVNNNPLSTDHIICTGVETSLQTIVEIVFSYFDLDWKNHVIIDKKLFRSSDVKRSCGNPELLFNDLGWKSTKNVEKIYESIIEFILGTKEVYKI